MDVFRINILYEKVQSLFYLNLYLNDNISSFFGLRFPLINIPIIFYHFSYHLIFYLYIFLINCFQPHLILLLSLNKFTFLIYNLLSLFYFIDLLGVCEELLFCFLILKNM
jgi:hypothetical protein